MRRIGLQLNIIGCLEKKRYSNYFLSFLRIAWNERIDARPIPMPISRSFQIFLASLRSRISNILFIFVLESCFIDVR